MSDETKKKIGLFDFVSDISEKKQYLFSEDTQTEYLPFMVAKAFSQHIDTILLANEVNKRTSMSKQMHHDFLFYAVSPKQRYGKWAKKQKEKDEDVLVYLKNKYKIGNDRSLEYYELLSDDEIKTIKTKLKTLRGTK